jgi:nucleoside-diphosphate-sugar epimerase
LFVVSKGIVLVAGAGGLVGRATIDQYLSESGWDVIGLSRRPPQPQTGAAHVAVDLTDAAACGCSSARSFLRPSADDSVVV